MYVYIFIPRIPILKWIFLVLIIYVVLYMSVYTDHFILKKKKLIIHITKITYVPTIKTFEAVFILLFFFSFNNAFISLPPLIKEVFVGLLLAVSKVTVVIWVGRKGGPHTDLKHTLISQISIQFTLLT